MVKGDRHEFRAVAQELNIDPDSYIEALHKVCISDEESDRWQRISVPATIRSRMSWSV